MKKIVALLIICFFVGLTVFAQAPQSFKYQAIVRDLSGAILDNQFISIRISIREGSSTGTISYSESFSENTNQFGLVNIEIGTGTVVSGTFAGINWGSASHFLELEMDINGGTNFQLMGTSQLLSVPYALYAANVNSNDTIATNELQILSISNDTVYLSNSGYVVLPKDDVDDADADNTNELQTLSLSGDTLFISDGNYIVIPGISTIGNTSFGCGDDITDARDGQKYATVKIGNQCWMAENMNIGSMINGGIDQSDNASFEKFCFDNLSTYCDEYGGLYQWDEAMQYNSSEDGALGTTQGICPTGWHVPTDTEWETMEIFIGMDSTEANNTGFRGTNEGDKLKETGTDHWISPNAGATNEYGFSVLAHGYKSYAYGFMWFKENVYFWTTTEVPSVTWKSYNRGMFAASSQIQKAEHSKENGYSIRCIKD